MCWETSTWITGGESEPRRKRRGELGVWGGKEGREEDSKGRGVTGLSVTAVGYMEAQVQFDL